MSKENAQKLFTELETNKELREKLSATGTSDFAFENLTLTAGNDVFVPLSALPTGLLCRLP